MRIRQQVNSIAWFSLVCGEIRAGRGANRASSAGFQHCKDFRHSRTGRACARGFTGNERAADRAKWRAVVRLPKQRAKACVAGADLVADGGLGTHPRDDEAGTHEQGNRAAVAATVHAGRDREFVAQQNATLAHSAAVGEGVPGTGSRPAAIRRAGRTSSSAANSATRSSAPPTAGK
jgi:hypothetical protein